LLSISKVSAIDAVDDVVVTIDVVAADVVAIDDDVEIRSSKLYKF